MFCRNGSSLCMCLCVSESFILSQSFSASPSLLPLLVSLGGRNPFLWGGTNITVLKHIHIFKIRLIYWYAQIKYVVNGLFFFRLWNKARPGCHLLLVERLFKETDTQNMLTAFSMYLSSLCCCTQMSQLEILSSTPMKSF